ncbi:MAG: alpha/beta hydrolase [Ilumatobacteraceae bacterium]
MTDRRALLLQRRHRTAPRHRHAVAVLAAAVLAAACFDGSVSSVRSDESAAPTTSASAPTSPTSSEPSTTSAPEPAPWDTTITWESFGVDTEVETGTMEVPVDYRDPSRGTFTLFLARHLADESKRIGSLLVNPGGPGFGGSDLAIFADQIYSPALLRHFDIIGWDPRGTGQSTPAIDCITDYDRYFAGTDITPDTDSERQLLTDLAAEFAGTCEAENSDIIQFVGTNDSARDIDSIRRALGEQTISYFGFSYGSELGATWATMFPDTVRAAVLDGASDPAAGFLAESLQQSIGFEQSITAFLAWCSANDSCQFNSDGNAEQAFDELMADIDERPVPSVDGRPDVTRSMALTAVAYSMYDESLWRQLGRALDSARYGDGELLLQLYDNYFQRRDDGTYDNSLEAFQTIVCMDTADRPTIVEEDVAAEAIRRSAPRFSPGTVGSYFCTFFPETVEPRIDIGGAARIPILVIGTTGDPATPLSSTRAMADALFDGRLVVVEADQHTGYGVNQCSIDVVDRDLLDQLGGAPADETECSD